MYLYLLPADIQQSIIDHLKIKTCSKCDLLRIDCQNWKPWKRNKTRNQQASQYKCDPEKCSRLVCPDYLKLNGVIIIDNDATEILEEIKCKHVPISLYEPDKTTLQRSYFILNKMNRISN